MAATVALVLAVVLACGAAACADPTMPKFHRPSDVVASATPPPVNCEGGVPGECAADSECVFGENGRCIVPDDGSSCVCTYDKCLHDSDCTRGQTCASHGPPFTSHIGNICVVSNCRVDNECAAGGGLPFCSPSASPVLCGGTFAGFYCHTVRDLCFNDIDCTAESPTAIPACAYSPTMGRWECMQPPFCN